MWWINLSIAIAAWIAVCAAVIKLVKAVPARPSAFWRVALDALRWEGMARLRSEDSTRWR
jgi:hypothetical protein